MSKVLRLKEVLNKTGVSRSSLYEKLKRGTFPEPIKLGERATGWIDDEVDEWIESRRRERVGNCRKERSD